MFNKLMLFAIIFAIVMSAGFVIADDVVDETDMDGEDLALDGNEEAVTNEVAAAEWWANYLDQGSTVAPPVFESATARRLDAQNTKEASQRIAWYTVDTIHFQDAYWTATMASLIDANAGNYTIVPTNAVVCIVENSLVAAPPLIELTDAGMGETSDYGTAATTAPVQAPMNCHATLGG